VQALRRILLSQLLSNLGTLRGMLAGSLVVPEADPVIGDLHDALFTVCRETPRLTEISTVVAEPYAPYVPPNWNRILVMAEAQNLAGDTPYVQTLTGGSKEDRIRRLYKDAPALLRIGPWDDGTLKLAVTAAWPDFTCDDFALSNAVPWSQAAGNRNLNPEEALYGPAVEFWRRLLPVMNPARIVTVGETAREIVRRTTTKIPVLRWASASPVYLNRVSWLFDPDHLCSLFDSVRKAVDANQNWVSTHRKSKIFYACHAASTVSGRVAADCPTVAP
jgi:hypothetical protein